MPGGVYGARCLPTPAESTGPEERFAPLFPPVNRMLRTAEHPFPIASMRRYDTMYVETGRYLWRMLQDFQIAGGKIAIRKFATPAEIAALDESTIFNCTGFGSRDLFNDQDMHPARGQ